MVDQAVGAGGGGIGVAGDDRGERRGVDLASSPGSRPLSSICAYQNRRDRPWITPMLLASTELCAARGFGLVDRARGMQVADGLRSRRRRRGFPWRARASRLARGSRARTAARRTTRFSSGRRTSSSSSCLTHVDRRHQHAAARMDLDEAFELQPLQRLADRRPATAQLLAELVLGDHRARPQLARDDHLLERAIGDLGQRPGGAVGRPYRSSSNTSAHPAGLNRLAVHWQPR